MPTITEDRPQHLVALEEANRVRFAQTRVKRALKAGELTLSAALELPEVGSMPFYKLAGFLPVRSTWQGTNSPAFSKEGANRVLRFLANSPRGTTLSQTVKVRDLTERQLRAIRAGEEQGWKW